jgi:2-phospho-L-lactate guanylyltransferase
MGSMSEPRPAGPIGRSSEQLPWRVVLPVKAAQQAKTRLTVQPGVSRLELARAMALDTMDAALACPLVSLVVVVTPDPAVAAAARAAGAHAVPDAGSGLNAAAAQGADQAERRGPGPIAVLLADLPTLRPQDLAVALAAAAGHRAAYVPDAEGTGTVLLMARSRADLRPAFGAGSAARHEEQAVRLDLDLPRLRRDVDVEAALHQALALGVGRRTAGVLGRAG